MHRYTRLCLLGASRLSGARLSVEYERGSSWRSAYGTKRTYVRAALKSVSDPLADIVRCSPSNPTLDIRSLCSTRSLGCLKV